MTNIVSKKRGDAGGECRHRAAVLRRGVEKALLKVSRRIWRRLPPHVRDLYAVQAYGRWLHALITRNADREMYVGTLFLRNRPALELTRRLAERPQGSSVRMAVLGCSAGVEVYSITRSSHITSASWICRWKGLSGAVGPLPSDPALTC